MFIAVYTLDLRNCSALEHSYATQKAPCNSCNLYCVERTWRISVFQRKWLTLKTSSLFWAPTLQRKLELKHLDPTQRKSNNLSRFKPHIPYHPCYPCVRFAFCSFGKKRWFWAQLVKISTWGMIKGIGVRPPPKGSAMRIPHRFPNLRIEGTENPYIDVYGRWTARIDFLDIFHTFESADFVLQPDHIDNSSAICSLPLTQRKPHLRNLHMHPNDLHGSIY